MKVSLPGKHGPPKTLGVCGHSLCITLFLLIACMFFPGDAKSLELSATEWEFGMRWIGNEEKIGGEEDDSDSNGASSGNILAGALSLRLPFGFAGNSSLSFVPGLSFYTLRYRWDDEQGRTVLSDIEWRDITAFVPLIDAGLRWDFYSRGSASTHLAMEGGVGFEAPIPVKAWDGADISKIIGSGYYGKGKFVRPYFSVLGYWPLTNAYDISSRLSAHLPVHHLWAGEGASFYDHLMISLSFGLRLPTKERTIIEPPEPPTPEDAPPLTD